MALPRRRHGEKNRSATLDKFKSRWGNLSSHTIIDHHSRIA